MSAPVARPDAAVVVLDGEAVIHRCGRVHVLDPVATLVWQCCDGRATVDEIGAELAAVFAAPPDAVRHDVGAAIEALGALDLLVAPTSRSGDAATGDAVPADLELLTDPPGSCATCADRSWARRRTFRIGSRLIAVGTNGERADAALAGALAAHVVETPPALADQSPFFGVELHGRGERGAPQLLNLVLRGDAVVARSRRPDEVLRAVVTQLASYGDLRDEGLAVVNGLVAALDDRAVILVPPHDSVRFRSALAHLGVRVADQPVALVDPAVCEVVVGAPGIEVDFGPINALAVEPVEHEPQALPWGRYRIVALAVPAPASPSAALLALGPELGDHRDHDATLDALLSLLDSVPVTGAVEPDAIHTLLVSG